jgi:GT2 family glycosyltransferase
MAELFALHAIFPGNRWFRWFYYEDQAEEGSRTVDTVSGAAMLIDGDALRRVGGFDPGFWMYFEEVDLCRRLGAAGYQVVFVPTVPATHVHAASTRQTTARQVEYFLSYIRFFRKHHGPGSARILAAAVAASTVLRMLALPLKYPPLSRRGCTILWPKLSACWRLLGDLPRTATSGIPTAVRP